MYIAVVNRNNRREYVLRESILRDSDYVFREICALGEDPSVFIVYPGGNAFYIDETVEEKLEAAGAAYDSDTIEALFWPWVKPDIKQAVETFRNRSEAMTGRTGLSQEEKRTIDTTLNRIDKRRAHFLKFGSMDQGPVETMPRALFKHLVHKSRDEIEQHFLKEESILSARDLKFYVYTVFNLHSFFKGFMARKMPHVLDQDRVDAYFLCELCRINRELFNGTDTLHPYLVRYLVMFFDYEYGETTLLKEMINDFIYRHHFHNPPQPRKQYLSKNRALTIFGIDKKELDGLTRRSLTRIYRKLALRYHPDKGGTQEQFIEVNHAYESLIKRVEKKGT